MARKENRPGLTPEIIRAELNKGHSPADIARTFSVSRQAVRYHMRKAGIEMNPVGRKISEEQPWHIQTEHQRKVAYRYLRYHGRYRETGGIDMSGDDLRKLRGFYRKLRTTNTILTYSPTTGFAYSPRITSDGNLVARIDASSKPLSTPGKTLWTFPDVDP